MGKKLKRLLKLITAIASIGGILYLARDQVKEIIDKLRELKEGHDAFEDNSDDIFDDDFSDDEAFPESEKDSRDYFTINISEDETEEKEDITEMK